MGIISKIQNANALLVENLTKFDIPCSTDDSLKTNINKLNLIAGYPYSNYDISGSFVSRATGGKATEIIDGSNAQLKSICGYSEVSENLIVLDDVEKTTTNGITYKIKNGVVTISGTNSSESSVVINVPLKEEIKAGTYTGAFFTSIANNKSVRFELYNNSTYVVYLFGYGSSNRTVTTTNSANILRIIVPVEVTVSGKAYPMLVKGSTAPTEFKQGFSGIRSFTAENLVSTGENLFDKSNITIGKYIQPASGYIASNADYFYSDFIVALNDTYTIQILAPKTIQLFYIWYDENEEYVSGATITSTTTITRPYEAKYIRISSVTAYLDYLMLNYGSTALDYTEYTQPQTIPLNLPQEAFLGLSKTDKSLCNEIDYENGVWYERVKEFTITEDMITSVSISTGGKHWHTNVVILPYNTTSNWNVTKGICSNSNFIVYGRDAYWTYEWAINITDNRAYVSFMKGTEDEDFTLEKAKSYFPLTIVYQLATPIVHTIDTHTIPYTAYNNGIEYFDNTKTPALMTSEYKIDVVNQLSTNASYVNGE